MSNFESNICHFAFVGSRAVMFPSPVVVWVLQLVVVWLINGMGFGEMRGSLPRLGCGCLGQSHFEALQSLVRS